MADLPKFAWLRQPQSHCGQRYIELRHADLNTAKNTIKFSI